MKLGDMSYCMLCDSLHSGQCKTGIPTEVSRLHSELAALRAENERLKNQPLGCVGGKCIVDETGAYVTRCHFHRVIDQRYEALAERDTLREKLRLATEVLEKISDPRKRDHTESEPYTEIGCLMNLAYEALKQLASASAERSEES